MQKPLLVIAAVGVGGYVIWQVVWAFVLPLLGAFLGFLWMALKIGLIVLAIYWVYRLLVKNHSKKSAEAT